MPLPNGVAGSAQPEPAAPQTALEILETLATLEGRIGFYQARLDECYDERANLLALLARIVRANPDQVIGWNRWCFVLQDGIVTKRRLLFAHEIPVSLDRPSTTQVKDVASPAS